MGSHTAHPPLHTAEHLITKLLHDRLPSLSDFGTRLKSRKAVVSFRWDGPLGETERLALERALQEISEAALPVSTFLLDWGEAEEQLPNLYQVPVGSEQVRVVRVGEGDRIADERACIGRHVATTAEIVNPRLPTLREEAPGQWRLTLVVD